MSVDRSHITTFRTYNAQIHEGSIRSVHKHTQSHIINELCEHYTVYVCLYWITVIYIAAEQVLT